MCGASCELRVASCSIIYKYRFIPVYVAVICLLVSCGGAEIQPLTLNAPPWRNGETSVYQITDSNGVAAGTARYELAASDGWTIRREIVAQGATETVVIDVSQAELRPQNSLLTRVNPDGEQRVKSTYNSGGVDMELTSVQNITTYQHFDIPSDAREQETLFHVVRALPLATGYATQINSFVTTSGRIDRVTVQVMKAETITVPAGTIDAWVVELETRTGKTSAWIERAAPQRLIKYVDGGNGGTFELSEYTPGE